MSARNLTAIDRFVIEVDKAMTTVWGTPKGSYRPFPAEGIVEPELSEAQKQQAIRLMRVNHAGEVSAQGLYQGQALTAELESVRVAMQQAAEEENDHLLWCEQRIKTLGGRSSLFNPIWYGGSFVLGAVAGKVGDAWSLGFVAETEKQVIAHLDSHLEQLSETDTPSRAILEQMKIDEAHHGHSAKEGGGRDLPKPIQKVMHAVSKIMTGSSYWC